ncbi:MAG: hypothetical protein Q9211_005797 [Gyalolechia sp. 1 TL-2023]
MLSHVRLAAEGCGYPLDVHHFQRWQRFVNDILALDTFDDIVGEAGQGSGKAKGVEFIAAFGKIEDEDPLELQIDGISTGFGRKGQGNRLLM